VAIDQDVLERRDLFLENFSKKVDRSSECEDELSRAIYAKAREAGITFEKEPDWVYRARDAAAQMREETVPKWIWYRVLSRSSLREDADLETCIEWAHDWWEHELSPPDWFIAEEEGARDLAALLLYWCFVEPERRKMWEAFQTLPIDGEFFKPANELAVQEPSEKELREIESQQQLGSAIRAFSMVIGGLVLVFTGNLVIVPVTVIGLLMAYCLIDKGPTSSRSTRFEGDG
jgi:hypothetical protein